MTAVTETLTLPTVTPRAEPPLSIAVEGKPYLVNEERKSKSHYARARVVGDIRATAGWLWTKIRPVGMPIEHYMVVSQPTYPNNAGHPDTGSCYPTVKAIIDGARDAGVVLDDRPRNVAALIELPAKVDAHATLPRMTVTIIPVEKP